MDALSACAHGCGGQIFVEALPGTFVDLARPIALVHGMNGEDATDRITKAFAVGNERSFDQDPRFGLCALAEIASRALSPAVNDPGTAIDVVGRAERILLQWSPPKPNSKDEPDYPNIWIPPLSTEDLFDDIFTPIARDGASMFEVQVRLQKALWALFTAGDASVRRAATAQSEHSLERAEQALSLDFEKERVRTIAERLAADA